MSWVRRAWRWLAGYRRPETLREAELRLALEQRDRDVAGLQADVAALRGLLFVRDTECRLMGEVVEATRRRVATEVATSSGAGMGPLPFPPLAAGPGR